MLSAISEAGRIAENEDWASWTNPYYWGDFSDYRITLEREYLLRYPSSPSRSQVAWDLAYQEINQAYELRGFSQYNFKNLLQEALNAGQVSPDKLTDWFFSRGFKIEELSLAENLLGDGQPAWVFQVTTERPSFAQAVFAILLSPSGEYALYQIYPPYTIDWQSFIDGRLKYEITDHNRNGQPEITVMTYFEGNRSTWHFFEFYLFEWQKDTHNFLNLAENIPVLEIRDIQDELNYDDPFPWQFGLPDASGAETIIAPVNKRLIQPENCPWPVYQIIYTWDGLRYRWADEGYVPYDPASPQICQVAWALKTGDWNEAAIPTLEEALTNWSKDYEGVWGRAGKDYLRLRLGIIYALHGRRSSAIQTLAAVLDHPEVPDVKIPSQLARVFLAYYPSDQTATACKKTIYLLEKSLDHEEFYNLFGGNIFLNIVDEQLGFADPFWIYNGSAVCDMPAAFRQSLQAANPSNTTQLVEWLNRSRIDWGPIKKVDLDGNGVEDWLVTIKLEYNYWGIFGLLRDGESFRVIPIADYGGTSISLDMLHPESKNYPVGFLSHNYNIEIFQIRKEPGITNLQSGEFEKPDYLLSDAWRYSVDQYEVSEDDRTISLSYQFSSGYYDPYSMVQAELKWESKAHAFILTESMLPPQEQVILAAEKLFFEFRKPEEATLLLMKLLSGQILEKVSRGSYGSRYERGPERIRPYVMYLLALAYELSGDQSNAVRTYWQLWKDYPANPYSLAARAKLEMIK
jgi:hypothetical protein